MYLNDAYHMFINKYEFLSMIYKFSIKYVIWRNNRFHILIQSLDNLQPSACMQSRLAPICNETAGNPSRAFELRWPKFNLSIVCVPKAKTASCCIWWINTKIWKLHGVTSLSLCRLEGLQCFPTLGSPLNDRWS